MSECRFIEYQRKCREHDEDPALCSVGVAELTVRPVCDCHTWPTVKEMHDYVEALENRLRERDAACARMREALNRACELLLGSQECPSDREMLLKARRLEAGRDFLMKHKILEADRDRLAERVETLETRYFISPCNCHCHVFQPYHCAECDDIKVGEA